MSVMLLIFISYSSFASGSGTFNLYSARNLPQTTLAFNTSVSTAYHKYASFRHIYANSKFGFTYGIIDPLEIYLGTTVYDKYIYSNTFFSPDETNNEFGWEDLYTGLKFYYPPTGFAPEEDPAFKWLLGAHVGIAFNPFEPANGPEITGEDHNFRPTIKHSPDLLVDFLNDFELYPLLIHLNLGYVKRGEVWESGALPFVPQREDLIRIGGGIEIAAGPFTRFVFETKHINPAEELQDTLIGSFGIRFLNPKSFSFDIGVDYLFNDSTDFVPDDYFAGNGQWRYKIGFTLQSTILEKKKEEKPKKGTISLTVNDIETSKPLKATVSFRDTTLGYQTEEDGKIKIELPPGVYHLTLSKEGYHSREASITVKPSSTININTVLRKKEEKTGVFTGTVSSFRKEEPIQATIDFLGTDLESILTDSAKGVFRKEIPVGTYNIGVSAEGYLRETFPIQITKGETTIKNIKLKQELKKEEKLVLRGIHFASGQATIPPDEYHILDKVAEVLKANRDVVVEIGGHTDAVGSSSYNQSLSERRAASVRRYLIQQGIDPLRLEARGYGESQFIASNKTREGRRLNRRIEFKVISRQ